ncbi:MAG: YdbL family protein [Candidatus Polarisedimenticolaceae bacterium]|nr:YdbL family protein [Candidatus Polarisedimenticolaceae bacterium]
MNPLKTSTLFGAVFLLTACVTINIYFPSAQAEEAAREMVQDILGKDDAAKAEENRASALLQPPPLYVRVGEGLLNFLIPPAHAAAPNFNVNTPKIRKIQARMKKRNASLKPYYVKGAIGFTRDAMVKMRNASAIPLKVRSKIKKMVAAENADRNALYRAIADANGRPEWVSDVRNIYAGIWIEEAGKGWWYQSAKGQWKQR